MSAYSVTETRTVECIECGGPAEYRTYSGSVTTWDPWERGYINEPLSDGYSVECPCGFADGEPPQY
jgi:hypothetical protein